MVSIPKYLFPVCIPEPLIPVENVLLSLVLIGAGGLIAPIKRALQGREIVQLSKFEVLSAALYVSGVALYSGTIPDCQRVSKTVLAAMIGVIVGMTGTFVGLARKWTTRDFAAIGLGGASLVGASELIAGTGTTKAGLLALSTFVSAFCVAQGSNIVFQSVSDDREANEAGD